MQPWLSATPCPRALHHAHGQHLFPSHFQSQEMVFPGTLEKWLPCLDVSHQLLDKQLLPVH